MASNKKAQILAAVMCASSIFGSYTVVSAETPATTISNNSANNINKDTAKVVASGNNDSGTITATVKDNNNSSTSTITLGNSTKNGTNNLTVDIGKVGNSYNGTFTLNSKNLKITEAGVITGTGLTVNGISESTISSIKSGLSATSKVSYRDGVIDTVTNGTYTTESKVTYSGVTDTVKDDENSTIASSSVSTNGITNTTYGKSITDTVKDAETKTDLSKLTLSTTNAKLEAGTGGSNNAYVLLNPNKTGNVDIKAGTVDGVQGNVTLSGKNVKLDSTGLNIYDGINTKATATINKAGAITGTGLTVNGTGTSSIKAENATTGAYVKNEITSGTMTTTARGGKWPSDADSKNKTTSQVSATGVRDTVYDDGGQIKATSSVTTSGIANTVNNSSITNTVNDVNTGKPLADSRLTTSGISNTTTDLAMTGNNIGNKMTTALNQNSSGISASATKKYEDGTTTKTSLTLDGDSAKLYADTSRATVQVYNTTGNVDIKAGTVDGVQGNVTLSGKNVKLDSTGLNIYDGINTKATATINKAGAITGTGLTVNGTGTSSIKAENATTGAYVKNEITSGTMTTTARGGKWPSDADSKNKTTSQVSATGVRDTVYDDGGQIKATSSVTTSGIANTVNNSSITNTVNDVNTGKPLADSRLTTSGISNTTTALQMTGTNAGNTMSTGIYQNNGGISATATKKDVDGNTIGISTLSLGGNSASLKVGNYGFAVDSSNNVSITGNNATLSGNKLTLTDVTTGKTATLDTNGLSLKDANGTQIGGVSAAGAVSGTSLSIKAPIDPLKPNNDYIESKVTTSGVADTIKQGGFTRATSNVAINSIKDTIYTNDGKELSSSNISKSVSDATESGSVTLIANKITTNDDATTTTLTSKLNLTGDSATLTSGSAYVKADNTTGNVLFSGNNATLSGSTFTLKDGSNNTARLTATGLSFTDASGQPIGGVSSTGAISGTSLNITAKNDAGNKTISKVDATSVTDTVYGTDGTTQVASSSVGINGISNNTNISGIAIKDDVNNTKRMTTSIAQDKNGVNISSTKYNVYNDGTSKVQTIDGISTISVNGAKTTISGSGNYEYKKDENGKLILDDKGNPIRSSNTSASLSVDGDTGTISLSGKNASLSNSTFTLKDITSGKSVASLGTSGLSLNKVNSDGTTANYGTWNSSGLTVTATNTTGNKTTSQVSATGVTDTVYGTDGTTQVASSSVSTSGITNRTYGKTIGDYLYSDTDRTKILASSTLSKLSTIDEETGVTTESGNIRLTANKTVTNGETSTTTSSTLSLGGDSASLKVGNYGFAVNSSNNVSITGKNVNLSDSTLTLKNATSGNTVASLGTNGLSLNKVNSDGTTTNYGTWNSNGLTLKDTDGKTATLTTSGLTLKDENGTQIGGINTAGAITGTSLNITAKNDAGNKTISTVGATGVTDRVYDTDGKTQVAYSSVGTGGITNNTNISGIAIKDDKNNTKTMSTSIAQNANGVNISSNKYNVYNDGTNTLQTTDGTSTISVNGAKTTISGYGYKYEKDENGKPILDEKGNPIRSSYTNASLSVDGESGIIGLSGKNVGLSANGLTLYKDVEGVKTQYASLTASGLNVNGTGYTTIKSTNATTGAMGQSQLSYNGVTDTVTNAAGNKTTSTVNATGTIDQVYDVDGKTRIAYSNVTTSGITDSFTKDGVTNSVTTNANGTTFASTGNGYTTIKGGAITTNSITVAGNTIDGGFFDTIGKTNGNTAGIVRTEINGDWITSIEGALDISRSGNISLNADKLTYSYNDGKNSGTLGALANKVDDIYDRTQGIDYDKATGTTTIDGNLSVKDETTTGGTAGSTGETGTTPINGNITANTANIGGVQMGNNTVTATTGNFENVTVGGTEGTSINKDGVTVGDKKSDNYTSITNNDVVVNNNGNKTSLTDVGNRVSGLESSVSSMNNRLSDVEDRIDKVGAMSAAIANLRTMGYDPEAPTEIAVGVGQYKSETGLALGIFHYPNQDFMLSASISTSGDEVMGGIGATWKLGRKSAAEKAKDEEARRLEKAEEMKKLAQDAKVKAQAERHAKLLAEREAQKTA